MAGIEDDFLAGRDEIFALFGVDAVFVRQTAGSRDPDNPRRILPPSSSPPRTITVVKSSREVNDENGLKCVEMIAKAKEELIIGDLLTINSTRYTVTAVQVKEVRNTVIQWVASLDGGVPA